jgi:uncharacterized protein YgfB (UPF0149 family)
VLEKQREVDSRKIKQLEEDNETMREQVAMVDEVCDMFALKEDFDELSERMDTLTQMVNNFMKQLGGLMAGTKKAEAAQASNEKRSEPRSVNEVLSTHGGRAQSKVTDFATSHYSRNPG